LLLINDWLLIDDPFKDSNRIEYPSNRNIIPWRKKRNASFGKIFSRNCSIRLLIRFARTLDGDDKLTRSK